MELNEYTHTLLALGLMIGAYLLGRYLEGRAIVENAIGSTLESLENGGYIRTTTDKDGDKELIPISEIMAKTLRESVKLSK